MDEDELVLRAMVMALGERYDDMASIVKEVVETGVELSDLERDLLCIAYKEVVYARRRTWRAMSDIEQNTECSQRIQQIAKECRQKLENEFLVLCYEVLGLEDKSLMIKASNAESKVFYLRMKGDFYSLLAEVASGDLLHMLAEEAQQTDQEAFEISESEMLPTHPLRLSLALNYSVFCHTALNSPDTACHIAKEALDAVAIMEALNLDCGKESTVILELLRKNFTVWTSVAEENIDEQEDGGDN